MNCFWCDSPSNEPIIEGVTGHASCMWQFQAAIYQLVRREINDFTEEQIKYAYKREREL